MLRPCLIHHDKCDVFITWGNNPAEMHPVLFSRVVDRRSRGEKVMVIDIGTRRTRTTELADLILPSALWVEKNGIVGNSERRTQQWFKLVEPPGEALSADGPALHRSAAATTEKSSPENKKLDVCSAVETQEWALLDTAPITDAVAA